MLSKIIYFSIKNRLVIVLGILALVIGGVYSASKLPIDAVPDITNNQVLVITMVPSAGAPDVERLITIPIEQATRNVPGIIEQRSFSRFGLSLVTLVFEDDIDIYWARQQVSERLMAIQSQIPTGMGIPALGPLTTGLGEIYQYVVRPKKGYEDQYSLAALRTLQDWVVRKQLLGTPGVADVSSFGGAVKQFEVSVNTALLKNYNLSVNDIFKALSENNQNAGGAYIEHGPGVLFIRTEGMLNNMEEIASIPVKTLANGMPLLIGDLAEVKLGEATKFGATAYNSNGEVAGAVVMMLKGENSKAVIEGIKQKIEHIQASLPEGVVIEPFLDRTKMVNNAIGTVTTNLLEGALIVIFVLIFFLGNLRAGFVVASVIPLSMLFAFILMHVFGVSGNLMSLGALDFGLLVDGAVIIVEAIMYQLHKPNQSAANEKLDTKYMQTLVGSISSKMMSAAAFGQIIILIVYLPILTLTGIEGKMFKPMAQTVSFALIGAFILSVTYVPMMSAWILKKNSLPKKYFTDRFMESLENRYEPILKAALQIPKKIISLTVLLFLAAAILLTTLGGEFIPKLEEGDFAVDTRLLSGSSLKATLASTQKAAKLLIDRFPEVEKIVTKIGSGEIPTDPMSMEASDLMIILKDKKEWTSATTFDQLADTMGKVIAEVPGITSGFQFPVQMRFNELMTGSRQDVSCKIFGENLDSLAKYAAMIGQIINKVEGAKDLYIETVTGVSQVVIRYDRLAMAKYGANIQEVNQVIQSAYAGGIAGQIFEGEKKFDLVVRLNNVEKNDWQQIKNLMVGVGGGRQVPLYELAEVTIEEGPYQIQREDAARRIVVGFNVRGKDVKTVVNTLQQKIKEQIKLPSGYTIVYGGQFENLENALSRLQIAVPIALLLILVMLFFAFNNIVHCLIIFSAVPLSAIGGIFALWLRDMPFSISAGVGFIALFGVAVLNGIVLLTEMNKLAIMPNSSLTSTILHATKNRLRPILITASVASLGFIPMAISNGAGAEVQKPLATVVIGGLLSATLLTLFVLPILYQMANRKINLNKQVLPVFILVFSLVGIQVQAQIHVDKKISIEQAVAKAMFISPGLRGTEAQVQYYNALSMASFDPAKLVLKGEFGKVNSSFNDTRYTAEQVFDLPTVYSKQKKLYESNKETFNYQKLLDQNFIKYSVEQLYLQLQLLTEKNKLLNQFNEIYAKQYAIVASRYKAGQDNGLEFLNMENWVKQHEQEISKTRLQMKAIQNQFSIVIGEIPAAVDTLKFEIALLDTVLPATHPLKNYWDQRIASSTYETALLKAKALPQLAIGYANQSFNTNSASSQRYNSMSFGLNMPLFRKGVKQKIKASEINENIIFLEKDKALQEWGVQFQKAWGSYQQAIQAYQYTKGTLLPNAAKIARIANVSFQQGQINYLEWSASMTQVQQIELQHLEALYLFNLNQTTLYYLLSK